jgi:hypothetical protein
MLVALSWHEYMSASVSLERQCDDLSHDSHPVVWCPSHSIKLFHGSFVSFNSICGMRVEIRGCTTQDDKKVAYQ